MKSKSKHTKHRNKGIVDFDTVSNDNDNDNNMSDVNKVVKVDINSLIEKAQSSDSIISKKKKSKSKKDKKEKKDREEEEEEEEEDIKQIIGIEKNRFSTGKKRKLDDITNDKTDKKNNSNVKDNVSTTTTGATSTSTTDSDADADAVKIQPPHKCKYK